VLSGRDPYEELITRPEKSYLLWRVVVCDQETSCPGWAAGSEKINKKTMILVEAKDRPQKNIV
jgi:hypothetical protein